MHAEDAKRISYDISPEECEKWVALLSIRVYTRTPTYAAWRIITPHTFIGKEDKATFTADTAEVMKPIIEAARSMKPTVFDVVKEIAAGHCLMISRPEWLARVLRRAAGETT